MRAEEVYPFRVMEVGARGTYSCGYWMMGWRAVGAYAIGARTVRWAAAGVGLGIKTGDSAGKA
jgi:hypothetical protein